MYPLRVFAGSQAARASVQGFTCLCNLLDTFFIASASQPPLVQECSSQECQHLISRLCLQECTAEYDEATSTQSRRRSEPSTPYRKASNKRVMPSTAGVTGGETPTFTNHDRVRPTPKPRMEKPLDDVRQILTNHHLPTDVRVYEAIQASVACN